MLSQLAVRTARPEATRQKVCGTAHLARRACARSLGSDPEGVRGSGKAAYSRGRVPSASRRPAAPRARRVRQNGVSRVPEREDGVMRATRDSVRTNAAPAQAFDARPAVHASGVAAGLYDP